MTGKLPGRRSALASLASLLAASPCLRAQGALGMPGVAARGLPPLDEFANVPEFEPVARGALSEATFARIAGGERAALERITFRPRMMVNTKELDLSLDLLGQRMFAPILVGPASRQAALHADGERATASGAASADATLVSAERSGTPLAETLALAPGAWRQLYPDPDPAALVGRAQEAHAAGAGAICLTIGDRDERGPHRHGWSVIERLRRSVAAPLVIKGIMQADDAAEAARRGIAALIVSNHGSGRPAGQAEPVEVLEAVVEAVVGRIPVLVDGGFRRGSDVIKALALGATAVLVCRPVLWGLAAYGSRGVRKVVEMLQTELARDMTQVGAVNLAAIRRDHIRVHSR